MMDTNAKMTPQMLIKELQQKLDSIAGNLEEMPKEQHRVDDLSHSLEDVIIDLECVRDYINIRH